MFFHKDNQVVKLETKKFKNEREKYYEIWKVKYNVELPKKQITQNNMIDFICGKKNSI